MITLAVLGLVGLATAVFLPRGLVSNTTPSLSHEPK